MFNIFNKKKVGKAEKELKKFEYKIIFKNNCESKGILTAKDLDEVYEAMCTNKFQQLGNGTTAYYWNANEITVMEVKLLNEDE